MLASTRRGSRLRYVRACVNVGTVYGNGGERGKTVDYCLRGLAATCCGEKEAPSGLCTAMDEMKHKWRWYLRSAPNAVDRAEVVVHADERIVDDFRAHFQF